jgi:hypothetical protein
MFFEKTQADLKGGLVYGTGCVAFHRFVGLINFSGWIAFTAFFAAITLGFARRQAGWRGVGDFKLP